MHHVITTRPQFLALFLGMFVLVGALDWVIRRFGNSRIKALMGSSDDPPLTAQGPGEHALEVRVRKLEREFEALSRN